VGATRRLARAEDRSSKTVSFKPAPELKKSSDGKLRRAPGSRLERRLRVLEQSRREFVERHQLQVLAPVLARGDGPLALSFSPTTTR